MDSQQQPSTTAVQPSVDPHLRHFQKDKLNPAPKDAIGDTPVKQSGISQAYEGLEKVIGLLEHELQEIEPKLQVVMRKQQESNEKLAEPETDPSETPLAAVMNNFSKRIMFVSGSLRRINDHLDL